MTIHPMFYTAQMVRALLDGSKTMTRRPMNPQPADDIKQEVFPNPKVLGWVSSIGHKFGPCTAHIPKHQPGDILWCREPGRVTGHDLSRLGSKVFVEYVADHSGRWINLPGRFEAHGAAAARWATRLQGIPNGIFKEACRLWHEVTDVRVELVQDITEEDAYEEGTLSWAEHNLPAIDGVETKYKNIRTAFATLWDSIYAPRGLGWDQNPWVWVCEFEITVKPREWPDV